MMNNGMSRLVDVEKGKQVKIASIEGGNGMMTKLNRFGIYPGDIVRVVRRAPFQGPVLLEIRGMEIALGRGSASLIMVEGTTCDLP